MNGSPNGAMVPPWVAEPFRLWSLHDMLRFYASTFVHMATTLERVRCSLWTEVSFGGDTGAKAHLEEALSYLETELQRLPLARSLRTQVQTIRNSVNHGADKAFLATLMVTLENSIVDELAEWRFLGVQPNKVVFYADPVQWYGEEIFDAFPDSVSDLQSAARCIALDEWTACVFHLMRAVESALHAWSERWGVTLKIPVSEANWQDILNAANSNLKQLEQMPKSAERTADLEYFGSTSAHFLAIKNAWRNHVAHGKKNYDEREAVDIMQHVSAFMRKLSERA